MVFVFRYLHTVVMFLYTYICIVISLNYDEIILKVSRTRENVKDDVFNEIRKCLRYLSFELT